MKKNIPALFLIGCCLIITVAIGQTKPSSRTTASPAAGKEYGVFQGRIPCQEIAKELNLKASPECIKRKVWLKLYQDSVTHQPTTYKISGMGERSGEGKWYIVKGMPKDPQATVFQLDMGVRKLYLLKGDENVLFILDNHMNFLPGNARFSYTLNRQLINIPWDQWIHVSNKGKG